MHKPLVSVIVPVFNAEKYLHEAIRSILQQTFTNFELIIINDGSTDNTAKILQKYQDPRLKIKVNKKRCGVAYALNLGIRNAQGKYIARMDGDDISMKDRLYKQVNFMLGHKDIGVLATAVEKINDRGEIIGKEIFSSVSDVLINKMIIKNPIRHSTVLIRTSLLEKYGGYDENLDGAEDYDLWLRLAKKTRFKILSEPLVKYRISSSSVSFTQNYRIERAYMNTKLKSIFVYGYPWWHLTFVLKSFLSQSIPVFIKKKIYSSFYKY